MPSLLQIARHYKTMSMITLSRALVDKLVQHVNRKKWWHVPPQEPKAYVKRGQFLASSFAEAEFWGRPLDEPQRVKISRPLIGDETTIERELFGRRPSNDGISMGKRCALDGKMKKLALNTGYHSIVLMTPRGFNAFRSGERLPRSMELNILSVLEPHLP